MIQVHRLSKQFSPGRGIHELSFTVERGEATGLIGPNGAGKSTTLRCLMGFVRPTHGYARVAGKNCWQEAAAVHRLVGYLPGDVVLPETMKGRRFLEDIQRLRGVSGPPTRLNSLLARFDLNPDQAIRLMSKGTRQKLAIIATLVSDPAVLILDEPTSGLDPLMQQAFLSLMDEERARGKTVVLSSHIFSEVARVCDQVAVLKDGHIVAMDAMARLRAEQEILFDVTMSQAPTTEALNGLKIVDRRDLVFTVAVQGDYFRFVRTLANLPVSHLEQRTQSLETLFRHFYSDGVTHP